MSKALLVGMAALAGFHSALLTGARASIGVKEVPEASNWGPRVKTYLASVGLSSPNPWCAAWLNYRMQDAAKTAKVTTDWPATGGCTEVGAWARREGRFLKEPEPFCAFLVPNDDSGTEFHHAGLVVEVVKDDSGAISEVKTIEGNFHDGVYANTRPVDGLAWVKPNVYAG